LKFDDEPYYNEFKSSSMIAATVAAMVSGFFLIIGIVVFLNRDQIFEENKSGQVTQKESNHETKQLEGYDSENQVSDALNGYISGSTLTSDELDFWDMYQEESDTKPTTTPETSDEINGSKQNNTAESKSDTEVIDEHKNQTQVTKSDGTLEWLTINPYITKHTYDFSGLVLKGSIMEYYEDSRKISKAGIDVSKEQGQIDFNKVKKAGIDFVMIKAGARGYGSGQLIADEKFETNLQAATQAGLGIGVYFFSQAVTEAEAVEEANLVLAGLKETKLIYPVVFDMESIKGDTARIDGLKKEDRTKIAKAFLDTIKAAGYKTMIYGNKEWLLTKINLSTLSEFDIWLSQEADIPDYPYKFSIWQYSFNGTVDGISGKVDMNISFIDYEAK